MKLISVLWSVLAGMACVVGAGCARKSPPPAGPATQSVQSSMVVDASSPVAVRSRAISRLSDEYTKLSHQLPGRTPDEHCQIMRNALDKLDQILSLLADPHNDLALQQNLATLEEARSQLGDNASAVVVEPAIDTGLRSAYSAVTRIAAGKDFSDVDFSEPVKDFKARIDELDTVHGLTHQVVVAEAVDSSTAVVSKLADAFASRIVLASEVTTAPRTEPATQPSAGTPVQDTRNIVPATTLPITKAPVN